MPGGIAECESSKSIQSGDAMRSAKSTICKAVDDMHTAKGSGIPLLLSQRALDRLWWVPPGYA